MSNKQPLKTFRQLYYELPSARENHLQLICRERIMKKCEITKATFFNWVGEKHRIPGAAKQIICEVMRNYYGVDIEVEFPKAGKEIEHA